MKILRRMALFIVLSIVQLCLYEIIYVAGEVTWTAIGHQEDMELNWGTTLKLSIVVFAITGTISALVQCFRWKYRWYVTLALFLFFCCFFGSSWMISPYRISLIMVAAGAAFALPVAVADFVMRFRRKADDSEMLLDTEEYQEEN